MNGRAATWHNLTQEAPMHRIHSMRYRLLATIATTSLAAACGGTTTDGLSGGGTGGTVGGTGGTVGGTGGTVAGAGGTVGGTGGTVGGAGGTFGGTGGTVGGTGGTVGGTGGTGGWDFPEWCDCGQGINYYESCYLKGMLPMKDGVPQPDNFCPDTNMLQDPWECSTYAEGPKDEGDTCCYQMVESQCLGGRPFTIGGTARFATVNSGASWLATDRPASDISSPALNKRLEKAWLADALAEHASIASFARFTLQLMAVGAPPELIAQSQQASLDEIQHARDCFSLASRFAGRQISPGALTMDGAIETLTIAELAVATLHEGGIGETVAALAAAEQLAYARDPQTRDVLARIAEDEADHADLAWRVLSWCLRAEPGRVRQALARELAELKATDTSHERHFGSLSADDDKQWHEMGRLTPHELARLTRQTKVSVIVPCLEALLSNDENRAICSASTAANPAQF